MLPLLINLTCLLVREGSLTKPHGSKMGLAGFVMNWSKIKNSHHLVSWVSNHLPLQLTVPWHLGFLISRCYCNSEHCPRWRTGSKWTSAAKLKGAEIVLCASQTSCTLFFLYSHWLWPCFAFLWWTERIDSFFLQLFSSAWKPCWGCLKALTLFCLFFQSFHILPVDSCTHRRGILCKGLCTTSLNCSTPANFPPIFTFSSHTSLVGHDQQMVPRTLLWLQPSFRLCWVLGWGSN